MTPQLPYGRQSIDDDDVAAVAAALRSDWLTTGPAVDTFEAALARVAGGHPTVAVNSGTAALHCAYAAAGLGPGTELVTTPLTFVATAGMAVHLGATVRFADIEDDTLTLDPASVAAVVSESTRVVTGVAYAGHPADWDGLAAVVPAHVVTVDDAAHAIGGRYRGRPVGDLADLTVFSFHPVKTVTTAEGGAVVTRRADLAEAVRRFRNHGLVREREQLREPHEGGWHQEVHRLGFNYRMPDVLAALGASQLRKLDAFVARRARLVARYGELLGDVAGLRLPAQRPDVDPAWHLYAVRVLDGRRHEVFDRMRAAAIGVQVHYLPVHRHPAFADLGYRNGMCPVAEAAYEQLLSLPLYPDLTDDQQDRVVAAMRAALGG